MTAPVPPPETLPVAWWVLKAMLMTVFPLHLIFMNSMIGATALAVYSGLRSDDASRELSRHLSKAIPSLVAFAVNLGVASLLFTQILYGRFFYTSSILMAVFWLSVIPLLMTAYYLLYLYDFRFDTLGKGRSVAAGSAFLILLAVAFIYTSNMTLMLNPSRWTAYFTNPAGTITNMAEATLWPRYLHFMIGGTAIGGLFVALYGRYLGKRDPETGRRATALGMLTFTVLTVVQTVDGLWFLQSLPAAIRKGFMGGDAASTVLFFSAVTLVLAVIMAAALKSVSVTAGLAVPLVYLMAFMRDHVRTAYLRPYSSPEIYSVNPQYAPMIIFFFMVAAGAAVVAWMLWKGAQSREK